MKTVLALACVLTIAMPASAEMLLAEFNVDIGNHLEPLATPDFVTLDFTAVAGDVPQVGGQWLTDAMPSDVGRTFVAPPEVVARLRPAFMRSDRQQIGGGIPGLHNHYGSIEFWLKKPLPGPPDTADSASLTLHVANLRNYSVDRIERTVDRIHIDVLTDRRIIVGAGQTVRLYGVQLPEPVTWLLLSIAGVALASRRRR